MAAPFHDAGELALRANVERALIDAALAQGSSDVLEPAVAELLRAAA